MHLRSKTVQQLLSVILSVVMVLSMLPMEVLAQETPPVTTPMDLTAITEDTSGDGWSWTQSTKTLTLTGLTLTVSDDSTHALILPDGATIDLADGTTSTLTGGSRSTVYSSGEVKLRGSGSLTVYGRGWRSATLDMFVPGTLTVEYDDPDGGAVLKTDEGTEGAAICANVTLDNGILRATGPDFASADDGSSVGLRGRLTTHGSSVEAQLTARTGYASYGLYFDKQGSGRGDTWTMGLGKVTAAAGHALSRYSYGLYVDYSSVNALELDGTQLTAMGGESDQYGSQGVFAGEEIIVKNGATVTATGGQVIATGGGAILRPENVTALRRSGRLVFLDRSPEKLIATADRPLASDREALRRRYEERYDLYCAAADLHIDGDGTVEETAQRIEKEWMK